ncbi:MAG: hypothetical protein SOV90_01700 [Lachnospiraceae bacterium]|nr:hypothetical protein [Eubacteriales bacterium]MDY2606632.1 hypothetical protein [Lachnospiraceae bacterium]
MNKENPDEIVKRIREKLPDDDIPESLSPENMMRKIKAGQNINIQQNLNMDVNSDKDNIRNHRMRMLKISGLAASVAVAMLCVTFAIGTTSGKLPDTGKAGINNKNMDNSVDVSNTTSGYLSIDKEKVTSEEADRSNTNEINNKINNEISNNNNNDSESGKWQDSQYADSTASGIESNESGGSVYEDEEIAEAAPDNSDEVNDSDICKDLVSNGEQVQDDSAGNNKYGENISGSSDLKYGIFYLHDNDKVISEIYYLKNIAISDRFMVRYMGYKVVDNKLTICLVYDNFVKSSNDENIENKNIYDNIINLEYDITDLTKPKLMN